MDYLRRRLKIEEKIKEKNINICIAGYSNSGKSSLIKRYLDDEFWNKVEPTISSEYHRIKVQVYGKEYACNLVDTRGFDSNKGGMIMFPLLRDINGFLLVFDLTDQRSFEEVKECYESIVDHSSFENQNITVIGNKNDLERNVPINEAFNYWNQKDIGYTETSAKTSDSIKKIVHRMITKIVEDHLAKKKNNPQSQKSNSSISLKSEVKPKKWICF